MDVYTGIPYIDGVLLQSGPGYILTTTSLSKSSLYATFGDKRELFLAALDVYRKEPLEYLH